MRLSIAAAVCLLASFAAAGQDLALDSIIRPDTVLSGHSRYAEALVHNAGDVVLNGLPVGLTVFNTSGESIWSCTEYWGGTLAPGDSHVVYFGFVWCPFFDRYYDIELYSSLPADENRSNDTLRRRFWYSRAFVGDTFEAVEFGGADVDGRIEEYEYGEWPVDISDVMGRAGPRRPRETSLLYAGWSWPHEVGFAFDLISLPDRRDGDCVVVLCDEDDNGVWEPDSGEGALYAFVHDGRDSLLYCAMPDSVMMPCSESEVASGTASGHLQFELSVPCDEGPGSIWVSWHGGYAGLAASAWRGDTCWGWWPQSMDTSDWRDPSRYGAVLWVWLGVEESEGTMPEDEGRWPGFTILRGVLRAGHDWFPLGETGSCLKPALLDITGRRVMDLQPGENDIRHLAPGVYFVRRPETEDGRPGRAVRKVVIQR